MNEEETVDDAIRMKPEFAPNSSDSNILHSDQFESWVKTPVAPRNIGLQQAEARGQRQSLNSQSVMFQGTNGRPLTDTMGWQNGMFGSLAEPMPQARGLRLVPSQQQSDFDSSAVDRPPVDRAAASGSTPVPPEDMSELLKLRSIIQAAGSRGLFPNPLARTGVAETKRGNDLPSAGKRSRAVSSVRATDQIQRPVKMAVMSFWRNKSAMNMGP